jgi:iron complex outermembrane recepter protein
MKHLFTLSLFCLLTIIAKAQTTISGKINNETKNAISSVSITLKNKSTTKNTTTDVEGNFAFANLTKGTYTITATAIGFEALLETVVIEDNKTTTLDLTLIAKPNALPTVEVVGRNAKKYTSDYSFSATRTAALVKDVPQSISTVTKELIADRNAFQLSDAVKIASGVIPASYYNQFSIRGVTQNEEGQIINGMRTRQYYFLQPLTTNIERVEVIKGPASATFASVDPGGSINMVTKKPLAVDRKEIGFTMGSFSTIRGTLDFTGPLNEEKTLLYRINGAYQEAKSFRDLVRNNSFLISPSISYIPNNKTSVNVEMIMSNMNGNLDRGQPIFGATAGTTNLNSTPISLNLGASNDFFKSKEFIGTATFSHKFSKAISFNAAYMKQTWAEDLQEHRTTNAFAVDTTNTPVTNLAGMQFVQRKQFWNIDNVNAYFNFDFTTGKAKHQLLVGYDLNSWEKTKGGGQNAARGFLLNNGTVANSFVRANASQYQLINVGGKILPRPNVNYFDLANPQYTVRNINDYTMNVRTAVPSALTTNNAIYIQEQLQWNKFTILLSLRNEWYKDITNYEAPNELSFTNIKLLPRIGVTYAVTKDVNVYATYLEGYQPQSNTVTLMPNTGSFFQTAKSAAQFDPLISDLKEAGTKIDLFKNKLRLNAAIYEINQQNILQNADVPAFPDSLTTRGGERMRGFEMDIAGFILPNWQINASYSYIDARIVKDRDITLINTRKQNTPYHSGNVWTRYNFAQGTPLKGLGIGLGMQAMGNRVPWFTRAFTVPGYTVYDMALYYIPGKTNMQLALNANNIFNKTHWLGAQNYLRLFPGAPRNIMLTATYKF